MAKDPAFLFYPADWISGTMGMTFEEKGAYFELLMVQFNQGHMTSHMIGRIVGQNWDNIKHKFVQDKDGLWFNERLELEKNKRKMFTDSRKNNIKGTNQHTKKVGHTSKHTVGHMVNRDIDVNKDLDIREWGKQIFEILKNDEIWLDACCKGQGLPWPREINHKFMIDKAFEYINIEISKGKTKSLSDVKDHFSKWIPYKVQNDPEIIKLKNAKS